MVPIIVKRELLTLLRSKGHRVALILVAVLILCAGVLGRFLIPSDEEIETPKAEVAVAVETQMEQFAPALEAALGESGDVTTGLDNGSAQAWVEDRVKADEEGLTYVVISGTPEQPVLYTSESFLAAEAGVAANLNSILVPITVNSMIEGGLSAEQAAMLQGSLAPQIVPVENDKTSLMASNILGYVLGMVTCTFLMIALATGIGTISQGVVEEKSSRVVEIILSSVRPRELLLGKILGIGAYVILQLLVWLGSAMLAVKIAGIPLDEIPGDVDILATLGFSLLWTIVGYFIFASLIGAVASTVSRQEDLAAVQTPFIFLMLIPFYLAIYLVPNVPDTLYTKVISWIPGVSSFMMPMRHAFGVAQPWEIWGSFALAILTIPLIAVLGGRIYQNSVLRMGSRVSLRNALKGSK